MKENMVIEFCVFRGAIVLCFRSCPPLVGGPRSVRTFQVGESVECFFSVFDVGKERRFFRFVSG